MSLALRDRLDNSGPVSSQNVQAHAPASTCHAQKSAEFEGVPVLLSGAARANSSQHCCELCQEHACSLATLEPEVAHMQQPCNTWTFCGATLQPRFHLLSLYSAQRCFQITREVLQLTWLCDTGLHVRDLAGDSTQCSTHAQECWLKHAGSVRWPSMRSQGESCPWTSGALYTDMSQAESDRLRRQAGMCTCRGCAHNRICVTRCSCCEALGDAVAQLSGE